MPIISDGNNQTGDELSDKHTTIGQVEHTGSYVLCGSEAYFTLQNKDNEHSEGGAETRIKFNDHSGATLAQIQGSHDGTSDDTKGDLILSTHDGSNLLQRVKVESSGHVGVGPEASPFSSLHVNSESTNGTSVTLDAVNDSAAAGSFHRIYRARGTTSSRTTAQPGDSVGSFSWWGYSEDSYRQVGGIAVQLVQSGTTTSSPAGQMVFFGTKHVPGGINAFNQNMIMKDDGKIGIGTFGNAVYDSEVSTLLTLSGSEAYLTLQNETDEHTDGGAETRVNFNDHSGTTLARIQGSHDGTEDDTKGDLIFSTHDGSSLNEAMRIESSGQVGIGPLSDPYSQLVVSQNTAATFAMHGFSDTPGAAGQLKMDKSRGTADSPTAVQADDTLGSIGFRGQTRSDGSSVMGQAASISVKAVTSGSSVSSPAGTIRFSTREEVVGGVNTSAIRMVIAHDGKVGIGTETPSAKLHLSSTNTDDLLFLETTEDSNSASPVIKLKRNSSSPADADYLGQLKFQGENDADQNVTYAKISGKIGSVTDGSEQGIIEFANMKNGSSSITARLKHDSLQLLNDTNLSVNGVIKLDVQSGDPSNSANSAHVYSKDVGGSAEVFVRDEAGNVTQISPHNPEGEWQYFSRNTITGKVVKVNMEKMIRKLEEITGETFIEEWYENI